MGRFNDGDGSVGALGPSSTHHPHPAYLGQSAHIIGTRRDSQGGDATAGVRTTAVAASAASAATSASSSAMAKRADIVHGIQHSGMMRRAVQVGSHNQGIEKLRII